MSFNRTCISWMSATFLILLGFVPATFAQEKAPGVVGSEVCAECHEDQALDPHDIHARIESFEVRGHTVGCEGCHGPGSIHVEEGSTESLHRFGEDGLGSEACMECHLTKGLPEWNASTHAAENVGCTDCHSVHKKEKAAESACQTCHGDVEAQFYLPSHHPVPEGKMSCASCHDVHNSQEMMLKTAMRPNDACYDCHQDKEGPFIFEHVPVVEDCRNCHVPHGAVANNLLTANQPALCLQCHEFHFHAGYRAADDPEVDVGGIERENPYGAPGFNIAFTTNCTQCHSRIHGSDLPSQSVPSRGRALTR